MKRIVREAFADLVLAIGGEGNRRYTTALVGAIRSAPVREAVEAAIEVFLANEVLLAQARQTTRLRAHEGRGGNGKFNTHRA